MSEPSPEISPIRKWAVAVTVMTGAIVAVLDISVVNVALPHMMGNFGVSQSEVTWVATSYSIAEIIMVTMTGWWTALLGRKRMLLLSFGVFTAGSVLCGMAGTFTQMLLFRVLQGIGGGALIPLSQAILRETFPREQQGTAMALYGMGVVLAPAAGPVLGGWLTDGYGWSWVFYINIPVCVLGMFMVGAIIEDPQYLRRGIARIDWTGIGLLTVGLTMMQVVLERGEQQNWFESNLIIAGSVVAVAALAALAFWELRVAHPIVNLRLLKNLPLSVGSAMGLVYGVALFGTTFILPQFTQLLLDYPAFQAGLVLLPRAIAMFLFMWIAGRLYGRIDARLQILLGVGLMAWSYYDLSRISLNVGMWNLAPILLIMGAGMPFVFVPLSTLSISEISRRDMTDASSLYTLARRIGGNIGYALASTLVAHGTQLHRAQLVGHVTPLNPNFVNYYATATAALAHKGLSPAASGPAAHALINGTVNQQAALLAYNDISLVFAVLFIAIIPLACLLPSGRR